ncbi:MAG: metallophosphoesterase family protein [Gammaproteobacteria bacterium]|nr:metallophosphoesterase family protein [Gammaproteobacteria bacterium]
MPSSSHGSNEDRPVVDANFRSQLEQRLGHDHARRRLEMETDSDSHVFGGETNFFHISNWRSAHSLIRNVLRLTRLYARGQRNALDIRLVDHQVSLPHLPSSFVGMRILHLTDLHIDMSPEIAEAIIERVRGIDYDLCVLTGDYRFRSSGDIEACIHCMARLRASLKEPVYAVLGNHDSIRMLPKLEAVDIRVLMNEHAQIRRGSDVLYLAGIDDVHFFGAGNIPRAMTGIPSEAVSILLSHTPEVYQEAADADVDLLLCGHTHGGQICLPGGFAMTLDARIPRRMGRGHWQFQQMIGYTSPGAGSSVVDARLNCPPEVTVHTLQHG